MENVAGIAAILQSVDQAFEEYDSDTLVYCYGHLYAIYNAILDCNGNNNFPEPHAQVRKRTRAGEFDLVRKVNKSYNEICEIIDIVNDYFEEEFPNIET